MSFGRALPSPLFAQIGSHGALIAFLIYLLGVFGLAVVSNRLLQKKNFLSEYFLGSRSLGVWAFALTFAASSASGGSFTGFPSKIYTHGWILGLWIGSYIVMPICAMGILGKRLNQVARISGSITIPDVLRDRFRSSWFGLVAVSLIVFFGAFNLVAQFKSGSEILKTLLQGVGPFNEAVGWMAALQADFGLLANVDPGYLLCLLTFALVVIVYTTYGGFHAVVWTDVMQGVVMVFGVMLMLPLAISQVGGLDRATREIAKMVPPRVGFARVELDVPVAEDFAVSSPWFVLPAEEDGRPRRLFRVTRMLAIPAGRRSVSDVKVVEIRTPSEIRRQLERLKNPKYVARFNRIVQTELIDNQIAWIEARLAADPPDAEKLRERRRRLESDRQALEHNDRALLNAPGLSALSFTPVLMKDYRYGSNREGVYVTGPGPEPPSLEETARATATSSEREFDGFLPLGLAISFFFMWAISGSGQPHTMVRLMAFRNTLTLRRAIFTVAMYYTLIYFPLVIIFCCARILLPGMDLESDRIMPQMAVTLTRDIGQGWLAGLLVAAPFAAVMSTVDSFLLMISSGLVRDLYQRNVNPDISEKNVKRLSYLITLTVGAGAMLGAVNPPQFLQDIIVYTGSGLAACFLGPMVFALYWPRTNSVGCIAGMLAGFLAHLAMYVGGIYQNGSFFEPVRILSMNPVVVGLVVSFAAVYGVTRVTPPPPDDLVRKYFYR